MSSAPVVNEAFAEQAMRPANRALRGELDPAYLAWITSPAEMLSVLDNITDLPECKRRVGADATIGIGDLSHALKESDGTLELTTGNMAHALEAVREGDVQCLFFIGERNNPYFTYYPDAFRSEHPEAFMRDMAGGLIQVTSNPIRNIHNPVLAVDDPTIMRLASDFIRREVAAVAGESRIRGWVIGSEEAYPDYFALPVGDFREASRAHYERYAALCGLQTPADPEAITSPAASPAQAAWYLFREQAIADRAGAYMQAYLSSDSSRPVLYPTHGHPFAGAMRRKLGQPPALIAGACDGFELGHITINDDDEALNVLYLANFSAFGVPIAAPRLGNKTLDPSARGGGRSFTPHMLRRLIYECVGMGVWHIGPIHWRAILGDGEWAIKDTPAEAECAAVFDELKRLRPILTGMSRLQPKVALYVSDAAWLETWDSRWTAFMQDALASHWNVTLVTDALVTADLAARIPLLLSIDNACLSRAARRGLAEYTSAGGSLLAWGDLGSRDELGNLSVGNLAASKGAIKLRFPAGPVTRTIVNQFQTGDGAWQLPHTVRPIPIADVEKAILAIAPPGDLRPIEIESEHADQIELFALTDDVSVAAIAINRTAQPVELRLRPADGVFPDNAWQAVNPLAVSRDAPLPGESASLLLAAHGSATIWFHPPTAAASTVERVAAANGAVTAWKHVGADARFAESSLSKANAWVASPTLSSKASCLAERIVSSVAIKAEAHTTPDGALEIAARVYASDGTPAENAHVTVRIVPGEFRRRALRREAGGVYRIAIARPDLPLEYDFDQRQYRSIDGPVRLVFTARTDAGSGGCMLVHPIDAGNAP